MTGRWAATKTLREALDELTSWEVGHDAPRHGAERDAALALVEAALDAAEHYLNGTDPDGYINLAAALRAVREGK